MNPQPVPCAGANEFDCTNEVFTYDKTDRQYWRYCDECYERLNNGSTQDLADVG